jgi:cellobiose phosphorylase
VTGTVAGYAIFDQGREAPELLLHPSDVRTGLRYSLLPMTRSIIAGLFTPEQAQHHLRIIREHLLFPDGARLMDQPAAYHGGTERTFRRAESAAFFGREIGLMYTHAHLRYAEAMAVLGRRMPYGTLSRS